MMMQTYRMMMEFNVTAKNPSEAREKAEKLAKWLNDKSFHHKAKVWRAKEIFDEDGWEDGIKKK